MLQNAEETATSPSAETPKEEVKATTEAIQNNGPAAAEENTTTVEPATEVKAEEPAKKNEEPEAKPEEPKSTPVEEPKVSEPVCEKPAESAPSPVKEDVPQVEPIKVVEESVTVESKEVRNDDVPPPLPSSNPPSPVTVFAESTKADALNVQEIPLMQSEPKAVESLSDSLVANASESKQGFVEDKHEVGDVKSESILSKSEKTDSELKTVEQKTIDIASESSDAIMSDISDAKNLSETLNNVSSIDTSETVVALSEPQIKSEDTSEAQISSEAVPEPGQPAIEEIPIDVPIPIIEKIVPELAPEQTSSTEVLKEAVPLLEPTKEVAKSVAPTLVETVQEVLTTEEKSKPLEDTSEPTKETLDIISEILETTEEPTPGLTDTSNKDELLKASILSNDEIIESAKETLPPVETKVESPKETVELTEAKESDSCPLPVQLEDKPKDIVETEEKPTTENVVAPQEPLPEPLCIPEVCLLKETKEENQVEQTTTPENSPVATKSSETLPPSPPPSPAQVDSKTQLEELLAEPLALPSPDLEPPQINAADSLPDISTESLPSLPEPFSENLAEPMSLPPVDSVPEPIAIDSPTADPPLATECPVPVHSNNSEVLTNGNTNGLPSPVTEEVTSAQPKMTEGPLKQVNRANENKKNPT